MVARYWKKRQGRGDLFGIQRPFSALAKTEIKYLICLVDIATHLGTLIKADLFKSSFTNAWLYLLIPSKIMPLGNSFGG